MATPKRMNQNAVLQRYAPLICWIAVLLTGVFICLKVLSMGYLPPGDARRHAAKPFAAKPYSEIVVMRPEYVVDHSPGWEWFLGVLHKTLGMGEDSLLGFSLVAMALCVFWLPLIWVKHPEAWLAALLAQSIAIPDLINRFVQGRPYLLTEGIMMALLFSWSKEERRIPPWWKIALTCLGFTLSVAVHGAWYLWVLLFVAFFLAQRWMAGLWLAGCWLAGVVIGALLTGQPIKFLYGAIFMAKCVYEEHAPKYMLVGEFQPSIGEYGTVAMLVLVYLWRQRQASSARPLSVQPVFWMILINWILGFSADRFWADWGMPAALVWMAGEFDNASFKLWDGAPLRRLIACGCIVLPLYLDMTNDMDRRYSLTLVEPFVDGTDPKLKEWMPGPGGIFYNDNMQFFYNTFYKNPHADWRYMAGFEPALMPKDDLKIYRAVHASDGNPADYEPWVKKLRPQDRLALTRSAPPELTGVEWKQAAPRVWIGRLAASILPPAKR